MFDQWPKHTKERSGGKFQKLERPCAIQFWKMLLRLAFPHVFLCFSHGNPGWQVRQHKSGMIIQEASWPIPCRAKDKFGMQKNNPRPGARETTWCLRARTAFPEDPSSVPSITDGSQLSLTPAMGGSKSPSDLWGPCAHLHIPQHLHKFKTKS